MTTRLLFEGPDTLVFWKESGIPSVPLRTTIDGRTLLSIAAAYYPEIRCCHGTNEWEGGVIHRLDNLTKGLVLIARNQKAYDALMQQQKKDMIQKEYRATVTSGRSLDEGFEDYPYTNPFDGGCLITSYFRSFGPGGKRHQIRAHLAWSGYPIKGDTQYGGEPSDDFGLEAVSISYIEPCSGRKLTITA